VSFPHEAPRRVELLGVPLDVLTMREAVLRIADLVERRDPCFVVTPNVDHVVRLQREPELRALYADAALSLADGVPLLWAARLLGEPLRAKVSGSDLVPRLCEQAALLGQRVFFLGGRPGAAASAAKRLCARWPRLTVAGVAAPSRGFEADPQRNARVLGAVLDAAPDLLLVGLGSPKQELWIQAHHRALGVPVSIGVGATFDYLSGQVPRAPRWMQRVGLEWSWRLLREPRRLWRRYLRDDPAFLVYLWRELRGRGRRDGA